MRPASGVPCALFMERDEDFRKARAESRRGDDEARHCERSEAIHRAASGDVDCFVASLLAMTGYFPVTPPLPPTTTPAFFSTVFIAEVKSDSGP